MCGIAGSIGTSDKDKLETMLSCLKHRGPDDEGTYSDEARKVHLGQRRLAIIDLSPTGHQPMSDAEGDVWVTFNGEIYNYKPLTEELKRKGYSFVSQSDTEVIIHGYREYGADIFKKMDGMWALALYDKKRGKLILSRDAAGIKPLYFSLRGDEFLFASEINALKAALGKDALHIQADAITRYLAHGYIYGEESAYRDIRSLPRASELTIDLSTMETSSALSFSRTNDEGPRSLEEAVETFDALFKESVAQSLQADVHVGIFLSGGIDSSLVTYYARENGANLQTFTIGFNEGDFDESTIASRIAKQFGFPSKIAKMTAADVAADIEKILDAYGQPFADMSAVPTYYLSKLARENGYKVVLTGDGADELFGGYPTHYLPYITRWYQKTPQILDVLLSGAAHALPVRRTKLGMKEQLERFLTGARKTPAMGHATWKRVFNDDELNQLLTPDFLEHHRGEDLYFDEYPDKTLPEALMRTDFETFLTWDCLVKSDISAMQHGVEGRVPFLNKPIIDFAWNLSLSMKVKPFQTKILLRKVLESKGGREFSGLPKQGFVPPLSRWLCADLKSAMLNILSVENVARVGYLNNSYIERLMQDHLEQKQDNARKLWSLMSLVRFYSRSI